MRERRGKSSRNMYKGIKDQWIKLKGVGLRVGGGGSWSRGKVVGGNWRQLYLNNKK